jgi:hypothetical protein
MIETHIVTVEILEYLSHVKKRGNAALANGLSSALPVYQKKI